MCIRIWIVKVEEPAEGLKHLTTAIQAFFCHRHSATLQGRVGRRDQAEDIKCLGLCLRLVISKRQSLPPFSFFTPLSPDPTLPIRPIHLITTGTEPQRRPIPRYLEIATAHVR